MERPGHGGVDGILEEDFQLAHTLAQPVAHLLGLITQQPEEPDEDKRDSHGAGGSKNGKLGALEAGEAFAHAVGDDRHVERCGRLKDAR